MDQFIRVAELIVNWRYLNVTWNVEETDAAAAQHTLTLPFLQHPASRKVNLLKNAISKKVDAPDGRKSTEGADGDVQTARAKRRKLSSEEGGWEELGKHASKALEIMTRIELSVDEGICVLFHGIPKACNQQHDSMRNLISDLLVPKFPANLKVHKLHQLNFGGCCFPWESHTCLGSSSWLDPSLSRAPYETEESAFTYTFTKDIRRSPSELKAVVASCCVDEHVERANMDREDKDRLAREIGRLFLSQLSLGLILLHVKQESCKAEAAAAAALGSLAWGEPDKDVTKDLYNDDALNGIVEGAFNAVVRVATPAQPRWPQAVGEDANSRYCAGVFPFSPEHVVGFRFKVEF
ncbi:hypothetical protein DFJ73DRAFT_85515 [Zopfochytrium polystomum]|nr:hypothetical protein DFJ73DRAFT_85515 [Zopfochytrium polystomum]